MEANRGNQTKGGKVSKVQTVFAKKVQKGSKTYVKVSVGLYEGQTIIKMLGGKRAERAQAAFVTVWFLNDRVSIDCGLRQDVNVALREATKANKTLGVYGEAFAVDVFDAAA